MTQMTQSSGVGQGQGTELTYPLSQFRQKIEKNTSIVFLFFATNPFFLKQPQLWLNALQCIHILQNIAVTRSLAPSAPNP